MYITTQHVHSFSRRRDRHSKMFMISVDMNLRRFQNHSFLQCFHELLGVWLQDMPRPPHRVPHPEDQPEIQDMLAGAIARCGASLHQGAALIRWMRACWVKDDAGVPGKGQAWWVKVPEILYIELLALLCCSWWTATCWLQQHTFQQVRTMDVIVAGNSKCVLLSIVMTRLLPLASATCERSKILYLKQNATRVRSSELSPFLFQHFSLGLEPTTNH